MSAGLPLMFAAPFSPASIYATPVTSAPLFTIGSADFSGPSIGVTINSADSLIIGLSRVPATLDLALEIQGNVPLWQQTVSLIETVEGPTIVAGGAVDLSADQISLALNLGLLVSEPFEGAHAEITGLYSAGLNRLTPTRGVATNPMCNDGELNCVEQISQVSQNSGYDFLLSLDRKSFSFVPNGGR
jgi:hypothetical protein